MKTKLNSLIQNKIFLTGLLCFTLAFLSLIIFIIQGDGFFIVRDDFNEQQIPFTIGLHKSIVDSGLSGFSWCVDLGSSTLQSYSFYELGSPFFWLSMLFPAQAFPYVVGWIYMVKYTVAGVLAFIYLRRFVNIEKWAVIGAVLYAFSGFSTVNLMYYHFHDVIALFPLLLIGLELLVEKRDCRLFIFAVFVNAILNYFFFIGETIFLVVYYLFRFASKDFKKLSRDVLSCIGCGVLGVGMASVLFIPSVMYIMQNSRSKSNFSFEALFNNLRYILFNLKGLILPAESMPDMSAIFPSKFYSTAAYLPMVGLVFVLAYIIKNRNWLSRLLIFCLVGAFWPVIGNGFFLYMDSQNRWWHAFVMMMSLATCLVLENIDEYKKEINKSAVINGILVVGLFIIVWFFFNDPEGASTVYSSKRFIMYTGIALVGVVLTYIISKHFNYKAMLICISTFAVVTTAMTLHVYRSNGKTVEIYKEQYDVAKQVVLPDEQYRLNNGSNVFSMVNNVSGFSLFTSTDSVGISEFENLFDYFDAVNGLNKNTYDGLPELLGGKYYIATEPDGNNIVAQYESNGTLYYLLETAACPIGYKIDSYITESELKNIRVEYRALALLQAAVVSDDLLNDETLSNLTHEDAANMNFDISINEITASAVTNSVSNFSKDGHGFNCTANYDTDSTVYFSVPYDKGWKATIDGQDTEIIKSGGMMLLNVPAGNHSIVFRYTTPYYKLGLAVSILSIILYIFFCIKKDYPRG